MTDQVMLPGAGSSATNEFKDVSANRVTINQSNVHAIEASTVEITMGGANDVNADQVFLRLAGARTIDAQERLH